MKYYLILFSILFFVLNLQGQIIEEPMRLKSKMIYSQYKKNRVKKVTMYVYPFESNGKKSKKGEIRSIIEYNKEGFPIKSTSFLGEKRTRLIEYDEYGNETTSIESFCHIQQEFDDDSRLMKILYFHKNNQNLIKIEEFDSTQLWRLSTNFDSKGEISYKTETIYDPINMTYISRLLTKDGELRYENLYYLDESQKIIKWKLTDNVQNKRTIETFEYDGNGNEIKSLKTELDGNPIWAFETKYNESGLEIESTWFKPLGTKKQITIHEYKYYN